MNDELLSAHLDDELDTDEAAAVEAAITADPAIARRYDELAAVRALLRRNAVEMRAGALERIVSVVEADDGQAGSNERLAPVVSLRSRRRVPGVAAVAAAMVIIVGVVGGVGDAASLPAIGELIAQHQAAAAVIEGAPMPEDLDDMPMEQAREMAPEMPADMAMQHAFLDGATLHLVYLTPSGESISVFRHEGEPDLKTMEPLGLSRRGSEGMWSGPADNAYVAVVDGTGFVWVVISEIPHDDMMGDMMDDLPTRSPSLGDRMRDTADWVVESFRFGN